MGYCDSEFVLVLNCDDIADIQIKKLEKLKDNTVCVAHPKLQFGLVREVKGYAKFEEKPVLKEWVSCGWVVLHRKEMLKKIPDKASIEYDVYPKLKLKIFKHSGFWKPLNARKDIEEFEMADLPRILQI